MLIKCIGMSDPELRMTTTFGIEFEGCLKLKTLVTNPTITVKLKKLNTYNDKEYLQLWIDYYFNDVSIRLKTIMENLDQYSSTTSMWFEKFSKNPFVVLKYPEDSGSIWLVNINTMEFDKGEPELLTTYDYPIITSDPSVICRDNIKNILKKIVKNKEKLSTFDIHSNKQEWKDMFDVMDSYTKLNTINVETENDIVQRLNLIGINIYDLFELESPETVSINFELITPPLNNLVDLHKFMKLFYLLPTDDRILLNVTNGTHVTYSLENKDLKQVFKNILSCYLPWQDRYGKDVRPQLKYFKETPIKMKEEDRSFAEIFDLFFGFPENRIEQPKGYIENKDSYLKNIDDLNDEELKKFIDNFFNSYKGIRKPSIKFKWREPKENLLEVRLLGASNEIYSKLDKFVFLFYTLLFKSTSGTCEFEASDVIDFSQDFKDQHSELSTQLISITSGGVSKKNKKNKKRKTQRIGYVNKYIFFYGTIRKTGTNYSRIENNKDITFIGTAKTKDKYSFVGLASGSYPYVTDYKFDGFEETQIEGDLYEIKRNKNEFLKNIDKLEYNYERRIVHVLKNNREPVKAYMYFLTNIDMIKEIEPNMEEKGRKRFVYIKSGDWIKWKNNK
jgi:gamma-glutamylcyclotransferase (GGCT)/AIG2-like uncharacterized protein YtfP